MPNLNYTVLKDYIVFTGIDPKVSYFLQNWSGLGLAGEDVTSGSPFGPIYNSPDVLIYNTFSATFVIDEDWKVYETITDMAIKNAPVDGSEYEPTVTDIALHLMNSTYQKEVAQIIMYNAYVQNIMNVENQYNTSDNTTTKTLTAIFKYQYHKFIRTEEE